MVMFIYRPEYYKNEPDSENQPKGYSIIDIAKHRNGKLGEVELRFVGQYARFEEYEQGADNSQYPPLEPNSQFEDQPVIMSSKWNDEENLSTYPSITSDQPDPF